MRLLNSTPPKIVPLTAPLHTLPPFKMRGTPTCPSCTNNIYLYANKSLPQSFHIKCPHCENEITVKRK